MMGRIHTGMGSQRGFSLGETLIAMAILALIGTLSFGTFGNAMESSERAQKITGHYHQVRQAMLRMAREIPTAFLSDHRNCEEPASKTVFVGKGSSHGMRLDFTSFSHFKIRADANESDQNELSYFVDTHPDDNSRKVLIRREQVPIDDEPEEGGLEQILAEDIQELSFEFYDMQEKEWEDEWDSNSSDKKGQLPMFVKIEMTALDPAGRDEKFVTKTRLFLRKSLLITGHRCIE